MEIVLGIDNIVFIAIVVNRLPPAQHQRSRTLGLLLALVFCIGLLLGIGWIVSLNEPLGTLALALLGPNFGVSGRDLILLGGGLFLLAKSTTEIHTNLQGEDDEQAQTGPATSFAKSWCKSCSSMWSSPSIPS